MREFFGEAKVLFGKFAEQVPHNSIMVRADGRAYVKNPSDAKKTSFPKGTFILRAGETTESIGLVLSGLAPTLATRVR